MSRTIEVSRKWQAGTQKFGTTDQLNAEWQEGPRTISGYASRKLRLGFALPTASGFAQNAPGITLGLSAKERI